MNNRNFFKLFLKILRVSHWRKQEDRAAHFRTINLGQGANMALPIWALYMQRVYADSTLNIPQDIDFEKPLKPLSVEVDCDKYDSKGNIEATEIEDDEF